MSAATTYDPQHRVTRAVATMREAATDVADTALWSMSGGEAAAALGELLAHEAQVAELKARLVRRVDEADVAADVGATSTANWLAFTFRLTRAQAQRETRLAAALESHDQVRDALSSGAMHPDQAAVVIRAVGELPDDLDPALVAEAEGHLVTEAQRFDAKALIQLGRRVLEVVSPEAADAHEAKLLEAEERAAAADASLVTWSDRQGRLHGRFTLTALQGAMFKKAILAIAAPKHQASQGPLGERKPSAERMGAAFAEYVERYPAHALPEAGGVSATVVVTMTYESLMGGLKAARLDTGETISASLARRLACEAGIRPAVLGGKSEVLDLGRTRRFHSKPQRIAASIEQRQCRADGCDWPPGLCHLHHPVHWSRGGPTDQTGQLLCPRHHAIAHDTHYQATTLPTGHIAFHRRS